MQKSFAVQKIIITFVKQFKTIKNEQIKSSTRQQCRKPKRVG